MELKREIFQSHQLIRSEYQDTLLKDRQGQLVSINKNTLYLMHLFYSDNEIKTVHGRPAICTLIGWIETSRLFLSFNKVSWV